MVTVHFIAMDTHTHSTDICVKMRAIQPNWRYRVALGERVRLDQRREMVE